MRYQTLELRVGIDHRSNQQVRTLLGVRIRALRKSKGMTQAELATRAGVARSTASILERGQDVSLDSFLSVLRALDLLDALDTAVPEPAVSPIGELGPDTPAAQPVGSATWTWGDES